MSSKASATVLLILEAWARFFDLQVLPQRLAQQQFSLSIGMLVLALILARHFPVRILLILIDPAAIEMHNTVRLVYTRLCYSIRKKFNKSRHIK